MIKKLIIGAVMLTFSTLANAQTKEQAKEKWKKNRVEVGFQQLFGE